MWQIEYIVGMLYADVANKEIYIQHLFNATSAFKLIKKKASLEYLN